MSTPTPDQGQGQEPDPAPTDELSGVVQVLLTGIGSKSEMESVVLLADETGEEVPLRRRDAVSLSAEDELASYAGLHVRVLGSRGWSTFVVDQVEVLDA